MATDTGQYGLFKGSPYSEERVKLDSMIINSRVKTYEYTNYDWKVVEGVWEKRPIYPNWTNVDQAVANMAKNKDGSASDEELAIRAVAESALNIQSLGQRFSQVKTVESDEFVLIIPEAPVKKALVYSGNIHGKVYVKVENKRTGEMEIVERHLKEQPVFQQIETDKESGLELFQRLKIKRKIRVFFDQSKECWRLHNFAMHRLGLTKGREMEGAKAIHREYTHTTTSLKPEEEERGKKFGFI